MRLTCDAGMYASGSVFLYIDKALEFAVFAVDGVRFWTPDDIVADLGCHPKLVVGSLRLVLLCLCDHIFDI